MVAATRVAATRAARMVHHNRIRARGVGHGQICLR
jgi:hypothetical protein